MEVKRLEFDDYICPGDGTLGTGFCHIKPRVLAMMMIAVVNIVY